MARDIDLGTDVVAVAAFELENIDREFGGTVAGGSARDKCA